MSEENNQVIVSPEKTLQVRFMHNVIDRFQTGSGEIALTAFQQRLVQNYCIKINEVIQAAEQKRNVNKEPLPYDWKYINMEKLALDVISNARVGLDPCEKNHIFPIPYKNNKTNQWDITFILGYNGIRLKAIKYGVESEVPEDIIIEVVYSNDKFKSIKRSAANRGESYEFEITNEFDRGEIVGGFYYKVFSSPVKNQLKVMSIADVLKRKPKYASPEFWGGEKDEWVNGKKTGGKLSIEGWKDEMVLKTLVRAAYGSIPVDSQRIDDDYRRLSASEQAFSSGEFQGVYAENANSKELRMPKEEQGVGNDHGGQVVDAEFDTVDVSEQVDTDTGEVIQSAHGPDAEPEGGSIDGGESLPDEPPFIGGE